MAIKISVFNQKGGAGKTITSLSVAAELAKTYNKRVLAVDCDASMNMSSILGHDYEPEIYFSQIILDYARSGDLYDGIINSAVVPTRFEGLDLIPAHRDSMLGGDTELTLLGMQKRIAIFALYDMFLSEIEDQYDYIIFDIAEGGATNWCANAFNCSDYILIPIDTDQSNLDGYGYVIQKIKKEIKMSNPRIKVLGAFVNRYKRESVSNSLVEAVRASIGDAFIPVLVRDSTEVKKANTARQPICYYNPKSNPAKDFGELTYQILCRTEGEPENSPYKRHFCSQADAVVEKIESNTLYSAEVTRLTVDPTLLYDHPMREVDETDAEITQSISENIEANGYLDNFPIVAHRQSEKDYFTILDGHKRRDAAIACGLDAVPVVCIRYPSFGLIEKQDVSEKNKEMLKREEILFYEWINKRG